MTGYYYNPSLPCEDPGEVDALKATTTTRRRTHSGDDDDVSTTRKAEEKASTSTKSIWTTSSWFQQQAGPRGEEDSKSLSKSFSNEERGIGFNDQPVLANCTRPENASNVGGLVHNRFTEKRSQRNPLHPVEAKSVNLFEHNQMSSGMRSIYSKGDGRNSANISATTTTTATTMSPFNSNTAVGKKCLDAFEFAKREHAEKRREHIRAKFTFDFERNKWTLNERALESEDVDRGADEKDAITVAADAADAAANANEENTNNINKNMTIHVEEEMNAAQMLHIQTTRELRLKKHLPRHESALLSAAKKASSSPSSPSSVVAKASEDLESAKKKKNEKTCSKRIGRDTFSHLARLCGWIRQTRTFSKTTRRRKRGWVLKKKKKKRKKKNVKANRFASASLAPRKNAKVSSTAMRPDLLSITKHSWFSRAI
jgi:hypothetical protein